jgi:hypothetical protein
MCDTYAEQAIEFEAAHGIPAPPEQLMTGRADWPVPFCRHCKDWHKLSEAHSGA